MSSLDQYQYSPSAPTKSGGNFLKISQLVAQVAIWASVAIIIVIIALALKDNLQNIKRFKDSPEPRPQDRQADTSQAQLRMGEAQDEADMLARAGRFTEAMHILLLRSVHELRRRLDVSLASSLTSREIYHQVNLPPEGRAGFSDIIGRVEISYFGPHLPGPDEYLACRRSFERLTRALGPGGGQ